MKNTVSKGILYYIFILAAVILGVACVFMAIMFFSPGTQIFGISYFVDNNEYNIEHINNADDSSSYIHDLVIAGQIQTITINTDIADVIVKNTNLYRTQFVIDSNLSGIIKSDSQQKFNLSTNYDQAEKTFTLNLTSPKLSLAFSSDIELILSIPEDIIQPLFNINITTKSGDVEIGDNEKDIYALKNLNITAQEKSNITLGNRAVVHADLSINCPTGNISLLGNLNPQNISITSNNAKIQTKNITTNLFKLRTQSSSVNLGSIEGDLTYDARKGVLIATSIAGNFSCSESVVISNITVGTVSGTLLLPSAESSNITIGKLYAYCVVRTTSGDVKINNAYGIVDITTDSGDVDVVINSKLENIQADYNDNKGAVNITTKNGSINAKLANVIYKNYIRTTDGNISCDFDKNINFTLNYNCAKNKPTLTTGITTGEIQNNGSFTFGAQNPNNNLEITNTSGKTDIKDTYTA